MSVVKLSYPAGITREWHSTNLVGSKLQGIRPVKIEFLVELDNPEQVVDAAIPYINQYSGEIYYLGSKVWSRK